MTWMIWGYPVLGQARTSNETTIKHNKSTTRSETLYIAAGVWPNFNGESDLMNIKPLVCLEFPHNVQLNPIRMIITTHLALFFVGCRYLNDFSGVPKTFLFREKLSSNPPKKQSRFFSWRRVDFTISILSILLHDHQIFNHYFAWCSVLILFSMFSFPKPFHRFPTFLHVLCPKFSQISQPSDFPSFPNLEFPSPSRVGFSPSHLIPAVISLHPSPFSWFCWQVWHSQAQPR